MSAWAKATISGKVRLKFLASRGSQNWKAPPKNSTNIDGRKSNQLAPNMRKCADDADVTANSLVEKGIKANNVPQATLDAATDPSTESPVGMPGEIQDSCPPCETKDAIQTKPQKLV